VTTTAALSPGLSGKRRVLFEALLKERMGGKAVVNRIPRRSDTGPVPLSFAQERLWFLDQLEPGNPIYNIAWAFRLLGPVDNQQFERCFTLLCERHESLRARFEECDGRPVQVFNPQPLPVLRCLSMSESDALRVVAEESSRPFDLRRGPLLRALLVRVGEDDHIGLLAMHHIVSDGWSTGVFLRELAALYDSLSRGEPPTLPPLPIQYGDFAVWQREMLAGAALESQLAYWKTALAGAPAVLELSANRPRPRMQTYRGGRESSTLPAALVDRIKALAETENATPFMVLLAAWNVLLYRYSGQADLLIGTPVANRTRPELEGLVGLFLNTLVLRGNLAPDLTFRRLLRNVRETALAAFAHQDLPFEKLVEGLRPDRSLSHSPLFQTMFVLQNAPKAELKLGKLRLVPLESPNVVAKLDLSLYLEEHRGGLAAWLEYNSDLFEASTARRMLANYRALLEAAADSPDSQIAMLPALSSEERRLIVREWNATDTEWPKQPACVHELFEAQARRSPGATAISFEGVSLTYAELDRRATLLARRLAAAGVKPETLVGVYLERSVEMVVAVLAILKAGGAYVPLDPAYPPERIRLVIEDARMPLVISQGSLAAGIALTGPRVLCIDEGSTAESEAPLPPVAPQQLAYVIYTSGSMGRPKGVQVLHCSVVNFLRSMAREPGISAADVLLAVTTLSFDIAGLELFLPLMCGAKIELVSRNVAVDGERLAAAIESSGATVMQATPATWRMLLDTGWKGSPALRALCGGEALPRDLADRLLERCPVVWNLYGPTETTIWSTAERVRPGAGPVSIGQPIANTEIYILDAAFEPVPIGVAGGLYIGGDGLARGYLDRPELTAERFVPNPFQEAGTRLYSTGDIARRRYDGSLEFLARADHQVKIRGHRIELGEIEAVLAGHPTVRRAVAVAREDAPGDKRLIAYVVPDGAEIESSDLRSFLKQRLPEYMIPSAFVALESLPLTPNGKIDRRALPAPEGCVPSGSPGVLRTSTEQTLALIWSEILKTGIPGPDDNFFDLGGHSLLLTQVLARVRSAFGVDLALHALFEAPTVATLAALIDAAGAASPPEALDLDREIALDRDIQPPPVPAMRTAAAREILLTGASGFLGAFLLDELVRKTGARIHCLVRAATVEDAAVRIRSRMERHSLWSEQIAARIVAIPGDLAKPLLGLSAESFSELAETVDAIYHNGAHVNFFYPYRELKGANVLGTQEVLRLAARARLKPVHFVSTISVCESACAQENEPLGSWRELGTGYARSKWVAEHVIALARERGIPVTIYRPGAITGCSRTGSCNPDDFLYRFIRGCVELGEFPDMETDVDIVPVDFVAKAIVSISQRETSGAHVFHLVNPHRIAMREVLERVAAAGYPLRRVPYEEWRARVGVADAANPLAPLLPLLPEQTAKAERASVDCRNTLEALAETGTNCPAPDSALIGRYVRYLAQNGLLGRAACEAQL